MKILWFTNTPSLYNEGKHNYNGGGWIESLETLVKNVPNLDLAISFFHDNDNEKVIKSNTIYYPIQSNNKRNNLFQKLIRNWKGTVDDENFENKLSFILDDFKPDIIHVFGTEGVFANINLKNIPIVFHIQGLINPYLMTYFPVNQSKFSFYFNFNFFLKFLKGSSPQFDFERFKNRAHREAKALKTMKYVMGRTEWDKKITNLYNPDVKYYHVDEVLRPLFYEFNPLIKKNNLKKVKLISTLSPTIYKGIDVVLKVANQLKILLDIDFEWNIIGIDENNLMVKHFQKTEGIKSSECNIVFLGKKNPQELIDILQKSDIYIHPSYIDNSPNSVCEAQILGVPVIACNVGGVSSLIIHMLNGILVPSNGVFEIVYYIKLLSNNDNLRNEIGYEANKKAVLRHDRFNICHSLIEAYNEITQKNISND